MSRPEIPFQTYEALFEPVVRTLFNWRALRRLKPAAELRVLSERRQIEPLCLPWTRSEEEQLMERGARLATVGRIPALLPGFPRARREQILDLARLDESKPQTLALPAVAGPRGRVLVLDGCHRLAALTLSAVEFRVALFVLQAPPDASTVIDLELLR